MVGRENETAEMARRLAADRSRAEVLILTGDPGTGKSALLDLAAGHARRQGERVLRAVGSESEARLGFAGLHQLLRPVLGELDSLPPRQRSALRTVLGLDEGTGAPDGMVVGSAVLTLVSDLAPLLVVVDDAQWIDRASLDVLSFVARRLDTEPVTLLMGVRADAPLPGMDKGFERLELAPLSGEAANRLLDRQPAPPTGRTRVRVLQEAAGNPLALIEFARAGAARHSGGSGVQGPLPLTDRLERIFAEQARCLPEAARRPLLLLAAADPADAPTASRALPEAGDQAWVPAEQAGLVRQDGVRISFRHPLIRSAVYHAASFEERRQAHLALAALSEEPDRRAWHLAAATTRPDEDVSDALRLTADRARRRGGYAAAAAALERAAELSPRRAGRARLLTEAAELAVLTGQLGWVERLAAEVREHSDDQALISRASLAAGQLMALRRNHAAAFAALTRIANEAATPSSRVVDEAAATHSSRFMNALAAAAVVRYYSGEECQRQQLEDLLAAPLDPTTGDALSAWVQAVSDPHGAGARLAPALPALITGAEGDAGLLTALAVVAWILDETALAARTFDEAYDRWQARGALPDGLGSAVGWTYLEQGRWAEARAVAAEIAAVAAAAGLDHAEACAQVLDATALALLGRAAEARRGAERALALVDPLESRSIAVSARRALGLAAVAEGDYDTAYAQFRAAFTDDGDPVHYHVSYTVLAELAAAAVRRGRREDAAALLERSARRLGTGTSARIAALLARGRALLAEPGQAEPHFQAALAGDAGEQWPFERAQTLLDHGEWLRRQRRIAEARPLLTTALETFQRLGARPWIERAKAELRAAGIEAATSVVPGALTELSPQQQQIVQLAARGLTNREIGDRLYLSPRTVGSHLYRVFPKLGITARSQLRDVLEGALPGAGDHGRVPV
ncbi:helix-turn-helix transcriptional regulator [Nonomuraea sp. PA05]|uniref:helix-turn-helix transcriptional regulator n=1 Tax=Nonomuraea sp. PA05 TaxID=2604466 RepID=UPI0011DA5CE1|nr:AAA family ATPase [Nonomuraea sp. PA05]TYB57375.1 helix-turn-helix transcriptional regulator [Nonomuraea sp. PA05]